MAGFIQSEVKIIHSVESGKPTDSENATQPKTDDGDANKEQPKDKGLGEKGMVRLGRGSVYRRLGNIAISSVENHVMREFDNMLHIESMYGDRKGMVKLQNQKASYKYAFNFAKGATSAIISSAILKNPIIAGLWFATETMQMVNTMNNNALENSRQRDREQREMYIAEKRQSRLIVGTYNRR